MAEGDAGQGAFQFTVTLDSPQSSPVTIGFATAGAARPRRPTRSPRDRRAFDPGETAKTATVQVNGDGTVEPNETFNVNG